MMNLVFLAQYHFTALVQRIVSCGEIQSTILTPDKLLNVLLFRSLHFHQIQYVGEELSGHYRKTVNNG